MRFFRGHLLMEILLGTGFAAVAFTGIALQVSNLKKNEAQKRALFLLEVKAKDHVQAIRSGASPVDFEGIEIIDAKGNTTLLISSKNSSGSAQSVGSKIKIVVPKTKIESLTP